MRVLVIQDRKAEGEEVVRHLQRPDLLAECVDQGDAAQVIARQPPDVLVIHGGMAMRDGYLGKLRMLDRSGEMYIVAILEGDSGQGIQEVLAAGAHDFARTPILSGELQARVDSKRRLRPWMRALAKQRAADWSRSPEVTDLHVWQYLGDIVAGDMDQMFGRHVRVQRGWTPRALGTRKHAATLPLSLPSASMEARVSIVADDAALSWLGNCLLGDSNASQELRVDALRELANTAGGALKRAALPEQAVLTTGLPTLEDVSAWDVPDALRWTVSVGEEAAFCVQGRIARLQQGSVPASGLREGMVVVKDIRGPSGTLLLAAGTRLTLSSAERVRKILGPSFCVEVAMAHAA